MMRRPGILVVLGILLATVAWWFFLISPRNAKISDYRDQLTAAVDQQSRLGAQIQQLQDIRDREVEYQAALAKLNALIPDRPLLDEAIEQLNTLADSTGVDLQTLAPAVPAPVEEGAELREIDISAQVQGQFFELLGFLFGLNDMERLVRVDGISMSSTQDESGATILSASVELRLFTTADLLPTVDTTIPGGDTTTTTNPSTDSTFQANPGGG
jgi:Tfp pilus assembly protein PilO